MHLNQKIAKFTATFFYVGKIKYAPGTFGSLVAFPLCYLIMHLVLSNKIILPIAGPNAAIQQIISLMIIELLAALFLFIIGVWATRIYIANMKNKDPSEVVIDEVVGQMITAILCSFSIIMVFNSRLPEIIDPRLVDLLFLFLLPFALFRAFDIYKPWPINWIDRNIKGAFGVMFDDVVAAIFAVVIHYVIVFVIVDFL